MFQIPILTMLRIRTYVDSDYEDVKQNLVDGKLFDKIKDSRKNLLLKINLNSHSIIVAEWNGAVVGNVFIIMDGWSALVFRLAVRKKIREAGIGTQLLQEAEEHLMKMGVKEVLLFIDQKNKKMLNWFKKHKYGVSGNYSCLYKKLK